MLRSPDAPGFSGDELPGAGVELVQDMTTKCFLVSSHKPKIRVSFKKLNAGLKLGKFLSCLFVLFWFGFFDSSIEEFSA